MYEPGQDPDSLGVSPAVVGASSSAGVAHTHGTSEEDHEDEDGNAHSKGGIPRVTRAILKDACKAIKAEVFSVNQEWQAEFGLDSYLNECSVTERIILAMLKYKAAGITLVSQRQEGRMGCDVIIQMLVPEDIQKDGLSKHMDKKLNINDTPSPRVVSEPIKRPERLKTGTTPSNPGTGANTPSKTKGTRIQGKVKSPAVPHLTKEEIPQGFSFLTAYAQAKWYKRQKKRNVNGTPIKTSLKPGEVREMEYSADFTYMPTSAKITQPELLNEYVQEKKKTNPKTIGVYILYGGEMQDVTLALLDDVISECRKHNGDRPCRENEQEINILMSRRFHEEGKGQECFLEHIAEAAGLFTSEA
ncbi:hypothetical protein FRC14_005724 [Serendipita sp. 396]|nr:hypothetical protein FRC14_005724 [Serendipita sp. 396]KAG8780094.1 hypothetical protein FRC15_009752 [Serendipita sp. 397]KAG8822359.1 hypothetical protein FRC18_011035 [Serendipita sp. 400]KAG8851947.1 hypothetical protein FRB91_007135 [Serendipita sp. 411]